MRFRPRFTLRTLFVLVTLAAIVCAWVTYQVNWIRQRHNFLQRPLSVDFDGAVTPAKKLPWQLALFG